MKIHQQGAKKFNKRYSLDVSIGLLSLILNVSSKKSLSKVTHENLSTRELRYLTKHAV